MATQDLLSNSHTFEAFKQFLIEKQLHIRQHIDKSNNNNNNNNNINRSNFQDTSFSYKKNDEKEKEKPSLLSSFQPKKTKMTDSPPSNRKRIKKEIPPKLSFKNNFLKTTETLPSEEINNEELDKKFISPSSSPLSPVKIKPIIIPSELYQFSKWSIDKPPLSATIFIYKYLEHVYFGWNSVRETITSGFSIKSPYQISSILKKYFNDMNVPEMKFVQQNSVSKHRGVELNSLIKFLLENSSHKNVSKYGIEELIKQLSEKFKDDIKDEIKELIEKANCFKFNKGNTSPSNINNIINN